MNKKLILGLLAGLAFVGAIVAFILGRHKGDDYCSVIPKDAVMVARVAPVELLRKNDIELDELADQVGDGKRFVKMGISYLKGCGVDITRPFYFFMDGNGCLGACCAISDKKDFVSVIKNEMRTEVIEHDGYSWVNLGSEDATLCFDGKKLLFYANIRSQKVFDDDVVALMSQGADESVMKTPLYQQIIDTNKSLAVNMDYSGFMDLAKALDTTGEMSAISAVGMLLPACNMLYTMDIEGSQIQSAYDLLAHDEKGEKELKEFFSNLPQIEGGKSVQGLRNPLGWLCFNFPGSKVMDFVQQIPGAKDALAQIVQKVDIPTLLGSIDGDVTLSLGNNIQGKQPEFLLLANTTKDKKYVPVLQSLVGLSGSDVALVQDDASHFHITQKTWDYSQVWNDSHVFDMDDESSVDSDEDDYFDELDELTDDDFGFDEEEIVPEATATTSTLAYLSVLNDQLMLTNATSVKDMTKFDTDAFRLYASDMKGCLLYGVFDVQELIKQLRVVVTNDADVRLLKALKNIKDVVVKVDGSHGEFNINMADGKKVKDVAVELANIFSSAFMGH